MTDLFRHTRGDPSAPIVFVGESWGAEELHQGLPFVGESGKELDRMIHEAGIDPSLCLFTNCFNAQPTKNDATWFFLPNEKGVPKWRKLHPTSWTISELSRLRSQISFAPRKVVVALGNYALWATDTLGSVSSTKRADSASVLAPGGITSWRGSMLTGSTDPCSIIGPNTNWMPCIHPAAILRAWYLRAATVNDFKRVHQAVKGDWRPSVPPVVLAPPSFDEAMSCLACWQRRLDGGEPIRLAHDIETFKRLITCMGFASAADAALVIPFVRPSPTHGIDSYWTPKEEARLAHLIRQILSHPNARVEGQNYIYDTQYIQRYYGITPSLSFDTMLAHHLLFPGTPKGLDYLSSLYCRHHWYWKDDLKEWDRHINFDTNLQYNAIDVMRTFECATVLRKLIVDMDMTEQWEWEVRKWKLALSMMSRGIRIDLLARSEMGWNLQDQRSLLQARLARIIPQSWSLNAKGEPYKAPWYTSPIQQRDLFYHTLGLPQQRSRKTDQPTVDEEALQALKERVPILAPLFDAIIRERSLGVFHSTFVSAPLDSDGRMRCSFNPTGTSTFRWSSSENAFGGGTNLQNVPKGED